MRTDSSTASEVLSRDLTDAAVRIAVRITLIALLVLMCWRVFEPFAPLTAWAMILAIALYPLHRRIAHHLGGRQGGAATVLVLLLLLLVGVPTVMLGSSFATQVHERYKDFETGALTIPSPSPAIAGWPFIGEPLYSAWSTAAESLPGFLKQNQATVRSLSKQALSAAASTAGAMLVFLGALVIAGIMMAYGEAGSSAILRILNGMAGLAKGPYLQNLSTAIVRSVAVGVVGVAFIQALLLGVGFIAAGIPAAGLLALAAMLLGILQLPLALISLPVIAYLWALGDASTISNVLYTLYFIAAGLVDNLLKPLLLGRGVDAPMPVILIGAMGGMVTSGIIGLFVGAVLLAVGYRIFMEWIDMRARDAPVGSEQLRRQS